MDFSELVDAFIAEGEALMTADSPEHGLQHEARMQEFLGQILARSRETGFPTLEEGKPWVRFQDWESKHGLPEEVITGVTNRLTVCYSSTMDLGWCDVCLRVKSAQSSRTFYEGLGFRKVEGEEEAGWAVVTNGELRLGLFEPQHMGENHVSLNFRGGDVFTIAQTLAENGYSFASGPNGSADGGASASLRDPDGHLIFFDTAPGEKKPE